MHRGVVLAALCVGCYAPAYSPGTPCESECPGNLVCIDHVCREPGFTPTADAPPSDTMMVTIDGPTIDGPPGDVDADGVLDNADNCPSANNADQHDEDADASGDVCDLCPHLGGSTVDTDGDKVGDACDPQPTIGKQRIAFFDPFTTTRSEWLYQSNTSRVGETLRISGTSGSSAAARLTVTTGETRTYVGGTVASVPSSTPHQLSIAYGPNANGDIYHYVEFYDSDGSGGGTAITERNVDSYIELAEVNYPGALPTGAWSMRIDESVSTQQWSLVAKLGGVDYAPLTASTAAAPAHIAGNRILFYVRNADFRLDYFLVIETMP